MALKYKAGDQVRIKSLDWYNKNIKNNGIIICGSESFTHPMSHFCDKVVTIVTIQDDCYRILEDDGDWYWTDEMIEGLAEEENKPEYEDEVTGEYYSTPKYLVKPYGYEFVDENGNIINATKISLLKKKEIIPNLQLDSVRTVREYDTVHSRIWLEIYEDNPKVCIFTHLLVDEDYRQKGYGTKALEQAEIIAKDLGCDTIQLKVETYSWMSKWYLRSGYMFLTNAEDNYTWLTKSI